VTSVASLWAAACSTAPVEAPLSERTDPKPPRLLHAFPEGSIVALCGAKERIVSALIPDAVLHRSVTQNYGLLGGFLDCIFWTYPDGSPTRLTVSSWRSER
jgi:hypothetical protein